MTVWTDNPTLAPQVRQLALEGKSARQIAKALKLTRNQVIGKVQRMGLGLIGGTGGKSAYAPKRRPRVERTDLPPPPPDALQAPSAPRRFSWE